MNQRRSWRDYNQSFIAITDHFMNSEEPLSINLPYRTAVGQRQTYYHFKAALLWERKHGDDADREYVRKLANVATDLVFSIIPATARGDEPVELFIDINPLGKGMKAAGIDLSPSYGESLDDPPPPSTPGTDALTERLKELLSEHQKKEGEPDEREEKGEKTKW